MSQTRPSPDSMLGGAIYSVVHREVTHFRDKPFAEKVDVLRDLAHGRDDLLGEQAGIIAGAGYPGRSDWPWTVEAVRILVAAGADVTGFDAWMVEGRRRSRSAMRPPMSPGWVDVDPDPLPGLDGLLGCPLEEFLRSV